MINDSNRQEILSRYIAGEDAYALAKEYNLHRNSVRNLVVRQGMARNLGVRYRKHSLNEGYFDSIDTEEKAYFLGFLFADGYNQESRGRIVLSLQARDVHILERFKLCLNSSYKLAYRAKPAQWVLEFKSVRISKQLAKLGCHQAKSFNLRFPEWLDTSLYSHFIRGYVDGDGGFSLKGKECYISVIGSTLFIDRLGEHLAHQCSVNVLRGITPHEKIITITVRGRFQVKRVLHYLYANAVISLARKESMALRIINTSNRNAGSKISDLQYDTICEQIRSNRHMKLIASDFKLNFATVYKIKKRMLLSN